MRAFGIDPGSQTTGWGVVELHRGRYRFVAAGSIRTRSEDPMEHRLLAIHDGLLEALRAHEPDGVAIEAVFHHKSSESAVRLGQARGVALLAIGRAGHIGIDVNPMTVKQTIGATGKADKAMMGRMVAMLLGVPIEGPHDVADALAIAMTGCGLVRNAALIRNAR